MLKAGLGRDTVLIGLGGGSTTDLAGFIAATYLRGIPLILVPTTLLAMVDAAIGGKTAVDTPHGKNLIGSYYHPKAVIADLDTLKTLPEKETLHGLAEILKMGLISDASILTLAQHPEALQRTDLLEDLVVKAAKAKIAVIEQDPSEKGLRRILNFGHTIAHALEALSPYDGIPHGEAVAIGCLTESYLSHKLGYLPPKQYALIEDLYRTRLGTLRLPKIYDRNSLLAAMAFDKKKSKSSIRFVLIQEIGSAIPFDGAYCRTVPEEDLGEALSMMETMYG
jgi:3-dehydroquinate synthase